DTATGDGGQGTVTSKAPARQKGVGSGDREHDTDSEPESGTMSPVVSPSWTMEQKAEPRPKMMASLSEPLGRPLLASSPVTHKKPKWTPPAPSGCSNFSGKDVVMKSPTQCLRLGLSRLARVKPLHPSATS
ncbi:R51A1 protein, partial [Furnarius figulus]|nr:R51A1 protein [Furnarius figulus]